MKNLLIVIFGFVFLLTACKTAKVQTAPTPPSSAKVVAKLQPLTQKYVSDLSKKDSVSFFTDVLFYNRTAIIFTLTIYDKTKPFSTEDGVAHKKNTDISLEKTIPELTPGKIIDWKFSKSNPNILASVTVTFDLDDKTYRVRWNRTKDSPLFELNGNADLVYEGKTYRVTASVPLNSKTPLLMFYGDQTENTVIVKENAKGVTASSSFSPSKDNAPKQQEGAKKDDAEW